MHERMKREAETHIRGSGQTGVVAKPWETEGQSHLSKTQKMALTQLVAHSQPDKIDALHSLLERTATARANYTADPRFKYFSRGDSDDPALLFEFIERAATERF